MFHVTKNYLQIKTTSYNSKFVTFVLIIKFSDSATSDDIRDFIAESAIMLEFEHPNVLKLVGICFETDHGLPMIVLPYMVNGALKDLLVASRIDTSVEQLPEVNEVGKLSFLKDTERHVNFSKLIYF